MNASSDLAPNLLLVAGVAGIFLAIGLALSVIGVATAEKRQIGKSLAALEAFSSTPKELVDKELDRPFAERVLAPLADPLHRDRPPAHRSGHRRPASSTASTSPATRSAGTSTGSSASRLSASPASLLFSLDRHRDHGPRPRARRRRLRRPQPDRLLGAELLHLPEGLRPLRADAEGPAGRDRPDDDLGRGRPRLRRRAVPRRAEHRRPAGRGVRPRAAGDEHRHGSHRGDACPR